MTDGRHSRLDSVVLLSGGLDSGANLALTVRRDRPVLALTFRYGQRAADREVRAAGALCEHFGVPHRVLDVNWVKELGSSALTGSAPLPKLNRDELDLTAPTLKSAKAVWVPNRNGLFINIAAAFAEHLGASRVVVGFNREEAATFPDNSVGFLRAATESLSFSTQNRVKVDSYTASLDKREIVALLRNEVPDFPFEALWSCYEGGPKPCGTCESCLRLARARGF